MNRPFTNYKTPITKPSYFFGREKLLQDMVKSPFNVWILLGNRFIGKSSVLQALKGKFFEDKQAFPVWVDLQRSQATSPENFRYIMANGLEKAISQWRQNHNNDTALSFPQSNPQWENLSRNIRNLGRRFIPGNVTVSTPSSFPIKLTYGPNQEKQLDEKNFEQLVSDRLAELRQFGFAGICFLLDGLEVIVKEEWANKTFWYLRGLKSDERFTAAMGLVLSGFKNLKNYQEEVSSPLRNIADIQWLEVLDSDSAKELIDYRKTEEKIQLSYREGTAIQKWAGNHPYLLQQVLNALRDAEIENSDEEIEIIMKRVIRQQQDILSSWWNSFSETEQQVYKILSEEEKTSISLLQEQLNLSENAIIDAVEVLKGTGVIYQLNTVQEYEIGAKLFQQWVMQNAVDSG